MSAVAIAIAAYLVPGVTITGIVAILILAVVLGAINSFIRPVLMFLTMPISVMTLGIFALILNTLLIMLAAAIVPGVAVSGFWAAFIFGIILAVISAFLKGLQD